MDTTKIFNGMIILGIILGFFVGFIIAFNRYFEKPIKSEKPIVPKIELVVKDNVIDTIYVYRIPE